MKTLIYVISVFAFMNSFHLSAQEKVSKQEFKSATEYNNFIINNSKRLNDRMTAFSKAISDNSARDMSATYKDLSKVANESWQNIKKLKAYNGDKNYLKCAKKFFKFYVDVTKKEFRIMLKALLKGTNITQKDLAKIDKMGNSVSKIEQKVKQDFNDARKNFEKENNCGLIR